MNDISEFPKTLAFPGTYRKRWSITKRSFDFAESLGFFGFMLAVSAIVFPAYLLKYRFDHLSKKERIEKFLLPELSRRLIFLCYIIGILVSLFGLIFFALTYGDARAASVQIPYVLRINSGFYQT